MTQTMQQIEVTSQNRKTFFLERLPIWNKAMVRPPDCYWNQFYMSLMLMYDKLVTLGFDDEDGEVSFDLHNGQYVVRRELIR